MQSGIKTICNRQLGHNVLIKFTEAGERADELAGQTNEETS
jgi:hypothetical protein